MEFKRNPLCGCNSIERCFRIFDDVFILYYLAFHLKLGILWNNVVIGMYGGKCIFLRHILYHLFVFDIYTELWILNVQILFCMLDT